MGEVKNKLDKKIRGQDILNLAVELVINIIEDRGMVQQEETMNIEELFFRLKTTRLK